SVGERALVNEATLLVVSGSVDAFAGARGSRTSLEALPALRSAALVFDARDVTLLAVKLPALSGARLARALPNLLEDSLLQDVQACAFALGPQLPDGRRLVAVIDRGWLEFVIGAFERRGIKLTAAWPAQLVLPWSPQSPREWALACVHDGLVLRTGQFDGIGWSAGADLQSRSEAISSALRGAALSQAQPEVLNVMAESADWQEAVMQACEGSQMRVAFAGLAVAQSGVLDLLNARRGTAGSRLLSAIDWRSWRLPMALACACLAVWLLGLNLHWGQMARESAQLRAGMEATFRETFPKAQVVVDPLLQMQRQVAQLRLNSGRHGADDFLPMLAGLSLALGPRANDALESLEYRAGRIRARFRASFLAGGAARETLRGALIQRGLVVEFDKSDPSLAVVRVRS
ncbi:MAG: type II secretion system protein GspL, partial [Quisquiliibacterium sp.]